MSRFPYQLISQENASDTEARLHHDSDGSGFVDFACTFEKTGPSGTMGIGSYICSCHGRRCLASRVKSASYDCLIFRGGVVGACPLGKVIFRRWRRVLSRLAETGHLSVIVVLFSQSDDSYPDALGCWCLPIIRRGRVDESKEMLMMDRRTVQVGHLTTECCHHVLILICIHPAHLSSIYIDKTRDKPTPSLSWLNAFASGF